MSDTTVTEREEKALVTIETAERLAAKAIQALGFGRLNEAQAYLEALVDATTTRTVTAVKDQALSDRIAHDAINDVQVVTLMVKAAKLEEPRPSTPITLTGSPGVDHDGHENVVLTWHDYSRGINDYVVARAKIAPADALGFVAQLTNQVSQSLSAVGRALATGDCDTCGNRRLVEVPTRHDPNRMTTIGCPECRDRYDQTTAFAQFPVIRHPGPKQHQDSDA
jgi:hypothetical protein